MIGLAQRVTDHLADPDPALPRERLWQVRASEVVLAAGAIERPLVFSGNDRPGIMLADAARTYSTATACKPGRRAVLVTATTPPIAPRSTCSRAGVAIAAIADVARGAPTARCPRRRARPGFRVATATHDARHARAAAGLRRAARGSRADGSWRAWRRMRLRPAC